jgi:hypothetical protein
MHWFIKTYTAKAAVAIPVDKQTAITTAYLKERGFTNLPEALMSDENDTMLNVLFLPGTCTTPTLQSDTFTLSRRS